MNNLFLFLIKLFILGVIHGLLFSFILEVDIFQVFHLYNMIVTKITIPVCAQGHCTQGGIAVYMKKKLVKNVIDISYNRCFLTFRFDFAPSSGECISSRKTLNILNLACLQI